MKDGSSYAYRPYNPYPSMTHASVRFSNFSGDRCDVLAINTNMGSSRKSEEIRILVMPKDFAAVAEAMIRADEKAAIRAFLLATAGSKLLSDKDD